MKRIILSFFIIACFFMTSNAQVRHFIPVHNNKELLRMHRLQVRNQVRHQQQRPRNKTDNEINPADTLKTRQVH
jgi:hypothetical protein